jgi:hypothetical protein
MDVEVVGLIAALLSIAGVVWRSVRLLVKAMNRLNDRMLSWDATTKAMIQHVQEHAGQGAQLDRIEAQHSGKT